MLLLGHRGSLRHAPENTLESFEIALEHGCDGFELDVRLTVDRHAAVFHDPAVAGLRSAIVNTFHELDNTIDVTILSTVVETTLTTAAPTAGDFAPAFTINAIIGLAAAGIALILVPPVVHGPDQGAHH